METLLPVSCRIPSGLKLRLANEARDLGLKFSEYLALVLAEKAPTPSKAQGKQSDPSEVKKLKSEISRLKGELASRPKSPGAGAKEKQNLKKHQAFVKALDNFRWDEFHGMMAKRNYDEIRKNNL